MAFLAGCASPDAGQAFNVAPSSDAGQAFNVAPSSDSRAADLLARSRRISCTFNERMGFAVAAADVATQDVAKGGGAEDRKIYNAACTEIAELSAPFGFYPIPHKMGILGMLRPLRYFNKEGLFIAQPYDAKKIPLLFIHGLMSDPSMWLPVMANIESDPILRGKYQFSVFAYPTGDPIEKLALRTAQRSFAEEALRFDRHSWAVGRVTSRAISA